MVELQDGVEEKRGVLRQMRAITASVTEACVSLCVLFLTQHFKIEEG
jgi:hypothetical protein